MKDARRQIGDDMEIIASRCRRGSGRRSRPRRLKRKQGDVFARSKKVYK